MEPDPSVLMDLKPSTTDQQERTQRSRTISLLQFAREMENLHVPMVPHHKSDSTCALGMKRNVQKARDKGHWISLSHPVLMDQNVVAPMVENSAHSSAESVPTVKTVVRCAAWDNLTAPGSPRTGTSTMASRHTTMEMEDLETKDTTGVLTLQETNHKDTFPMISFDSVTCSI